MYAMEEAEQIEFGCSFGDLICTSFESQARGMGDFLGWLAELVLGSQDLSPGSKLWDAAIGETSNWFAISIIVMLATGVIALATGMLSMKQTNVWMAIAGICAAIPSTYLALTLGGELLRISDMVSELTLERLGGEEGFANVFRATAQGGTGSDLGGTAANLLTGGTASALPTLLMLILVIIGLIMMSFALAFRNLGLMILIAFAPLAFMAVPMKGGWGIAKKWGLAGIALLLSKPLMFGVLAMILKTADGMTLFSPETLTVATGLFVVSFMPMMAYSFFSFLGSGNENMAGQQMAGQAAQKATAPGRQAATTASMRGGGMFRGGSGAGAAGKAVASKPGSAGKGAPSTGKGGGAGSGGAGTPSGGGGTPQVPGGPKPQSGRGPSTPSGGRGGGAPTPKPAPRSQPRF